MQGFITIVLFLELKFFSDLCVSVWFSGDGNIKYNCTVCDKTFKSQKNCFYHLTCGGDGLKKPLMCNECNKTFKVQSHFDYHMLTHSGNYF